MFPISEFLENMLDYNHQNVFKLCRTTQMIQENQGFEHTKQLRKIQQTRFPQIDFPHPIIFASTLFKESYNRQLKN